MNTHIDYIKTRRSQRNFIADDIPEGIIINILNTAIQAPSSKNQQNWYFIVLKGEKKKEIADIVLKELDLNHRNNSPTCSVKHSCEIIKVAPILILVFNKSPYVGGEERLKANPTDDNLLLWNVEIQGISAAIQNLLLAAHAYDLGSLWIADIMFARHKICEHLNCEYDLISGVSIGICEEKYNIVRERNLDVKFYE
jgi:nitroreductase